VLLDVEMSEEEIEDKVISSTLQPDVTKKKGSKTYEV
jgi:hypothetical protein